MAWTREDWNSIIRDVNEVLENPPPDTDCEPQGTLDEVGPGHIWTKGDIQQVQDALKGTCDEISFGTIPDLWRQSIIDEINEAIGMAWCNCEPDDDDCDQELIDSEDGTVILIYDNGPPRVASNCFGDESGAGTPICDLINGMTVGAPNIVGRIWTVRQINHRNGGGDFVTNVKSGTVNCDGTVKCLGGGMFVNYSSGAYVYCPNCIDDTCALALANAADLIDDPDVGYQTWELTINAAGAACFNCSGGGGGGGGGGGHGGE